MFKIFNSHFHFSPCWTEGNIFKDKLIYLKNEIVTQFSLFLAFELWATLKIRNTSCPSILQVYEGFDLRCTDQQTSINLQVRIVLGMMLFFDWFAKLKIWIHVQEIHTFIPIYLRASSSCNQDLIHVEFKKSQWIETRKYPRRRQLQRFKL